MSIDRVIPYRHGQTPSTYTSVYSLSNRSIIQNPPPPKKFNPPLSSLFMFLYFPQFSPMTSHALQSKKSRKRQARTRMLVVCLQYCVERGAERLKDTHSVLAWRHHKSPIVDLSLCVFVSVCMSRIGFLCLNYVCGEKNESVQWPAALHCVCIFVSYTVRVFSIAVFVVFILSCPLLHVCLCVSSSQWKSPVE